MPYCTVEDIKEVLQDDSETYNTEIAGVIASSDAIVDALLAEKRAEGFGSAALQMEASRHFAAWLLRRRRDPVGAKAFYDEAVTFVDLCVKSEGREVTVRKG
jgi:hypothetical protein